jgi:hypothetical protein
MKPNAGQQKSLATNSHVDPNQRKIAAVMALAENHKSEISQTLMAMWLRAMKPYTAEQVEAGVERLIMTGKTQKMPPYAVLDEAIRDASGLPPVVDAAQNLKSQAESEWAQVLDQVRRVGSYGSPRFHPTTQRVLRSMGGWSALCESMTSANRDFKRRDFISMWQTYHETGDAMELGAFGVQQALEERMGQRPAELPSGWLKRLQ